MSDTRFTSLKTDPRFRRPKKHHSKVVLDDRFKDLLGNKKRVKKGAEQTTVRVDKYGRTVSETQEKDDLRRFYRLEDEDGDENGGGDPTIIDYARGAVLMESSDEEDDGVNLPTYIRSTDGGDSDSDECGFVSLGTDPKKLDEDEEEVEIDLDENTIATLDAQVTEYAKAVPERETAADIKKTKRLAVVNLDWDYVRAAHLYKILSSLVSPTAPLASASTSHANETLAGKNGVSVARGRIMSVRVYPSEFGKKRLAREEKEGPPAEVFRKKKKKSEDEEIDEKTIFETGDEADYDEDALRKYQLERLRYYYAIIQCDTVEAAGHIYNELEGTELERSANVFDLSFVPDDMKFDDEPRDEATQPSDAPYRAVEFVTDALRHSKIKLTWDEDDPERNHILRRPLTKKEIEDADFRAYVASSSSEEDSEDDSADDRPSKETGAREMKNSGKSSKKAGRDKLRALLLGGNSDELPEGWANAFDNKANKTRGGGDSDIDMEVTFMPGLSERKNMEDETTLERYQRKQKEKRKKKKEKVRSKVVAEDDVSMKKTTKPSLDEFFGVESDNQCLEEEQLAPCQSRKKSAKFERPSEPSMAELALLAASDNPNGEVAHFDMKAILKAEKSKNKRSKHKSKERDVDSGPAETQDDFVIDVKDDRFTAIHEDYQFAIDPTNPQFKKTKGMTALLAERMRLKKGSSRSTNSVHPRDSSQQQDDRGLQSLVESVKRKSVAVDHRLGKRRRPEKS